MSEISFCLAGGDGTIGKYAVALTRSIRDYYPDAPIIIVIPESESKTNDLSGEEVTTLASEIPIKNYGPAAKIEALKVAQSVTESPVCLLDTDTLIVGKIDSTYNKLNVSGTEILAKPSDYAYIREILPERALNLVCEDLGYELPEGRVTCTVDGRECYPIYNAGMIITSCDEFGKDWVRVTKSLRNHHINMGRYGDQVALGILSSIYSFNSVSEKLNFPVPFRFYVPNSTKIIHYHNPHQLIKAPNFRSSSGISTLSEEFNIKWDLPESVYYYFKRMYLTINARKRSKLLNTQADVKQAGSGTVYEG
jgi:hypothetical protein